VVAEAALLAENHPEVVLTGIHIGHYGEDLDPASSLSVVVAHLLEAVPRVRFRLGSVEATEVDDLMLDLLADSNGRLATHLHMPLQSGSNAVLRAMRRWHTREQYRDRAREIAERVPVLGLGADIITGFPGEREADHTATRELVEELPFTYLHVFPFSPRDNTPASEHPDPVPQRIAGERARELRELGQEKGRLYRQGRVGSRADVILENRGLGLTEDYLRIEVRGEPSADGGRHPGLLRGDGGHLYIDLAQENDAF
jgi:threonylcarbamoyladenosine tRNA methylthiotransferase MtaB